MTPLADRLLALATETVDAGARIIFIAGPQGVGKSTAMATLTAAIPGSVAGDFEIACKQAPTFQTRCHTPPRMSGRPARVRWMS